MKTKPDDVPPVLGISVVASAKLTINQQAKAMSIELSRDELQKFAILLVAIEQQ